MGFVASGHAACRFRVSAISRLRFSNEQFHWGFIGIVALLSEVVCSIGLISVDFEPDAPPPFQNNEFESVFIAIIVCVFQVGLLGFWVSDGGRAQRDGHKNKIEIVTLTAVSRQNMKSRELYLPEILQAKCKFRKLSDMPHA